MLAELTTISVGGDGTKVFHLDDPELFQHPLAYVSEPGFWTMSASEAESVRGYLLRGGFLIFDDFEREQWIHFDTQIQRWSDQGFFPVDITNDAYKLGINYVVYAMTH